MWAFFCKISHQSCYSSIKIRKRGAGRLRPSRPPLALFAARLCASAAALAAALRAALRLRRPAGPEAAAAAGAAAAARRAAQPRQAATEALRAAGGRAQHARIGPRGRDRGGAAAYHHTGTLRRPGTLPLKIDKGTAAGRTQGPRSGRRRRACPLRGAAGRAPPTAAPQGPPGGPARPHRPACRAAAVGVQPPERAPTRAGEAAGCVHGPARPMRPARGAYLRPSRPQGVGGMRAGAGAVSGPGRGPHWARRRDQRRQSAGSARGAGWIERGGRRRGRSAGLARWWLLFVGQRRGPANLGAVPPAPP